MNEQIKPPVVAGGGMSAWRRIPGFPDHEASEAGEIRRITNGKGRAQPGLILKQRVRPNGYAVVSIGGRKHFVHRLVCAAFHGAPVKGLEASHENGDQTDNSKGNLKWRTPKENAALKLAHGTHAEGSQCHTAKLTEMQAMIARSAYRLKMNTQAEIAAFFGVSRATISDLICNRTWRHVE